MPRDDIYAPHVELARRYDADDDDSDEAIERRECHCCGGVPSREAEPVHPCDECGEDCCTTCCYDGRGTCRDCVRARHEDDERYDDEKAALAGEASWEEGDDGGT